MSTKPDAPEIRAFLAELLNRDWIQRTERRVWPLYAFHYTDIRNAAKILQTGALQSRQRMEESQQLEVSSGSQEILMYTDSWVKDCVRFYFRPKTPTQYHAEGVKSSLTHAAGHYKAHCPVPVFLLFDLADLLCMQESKFSDKNLGSHHYHIYSTAKELSNLDWMKIYHNSSLDMQAQLGKEVIACRNAEVIVPGQLDLQFLKFIYCRSQAELETLFYLLPLRLRQKYKSKIISSSRSEFFFRKQTFLETVRLSAERVDLNFSPDTHSPGPFELAYEIKSLKGVPLRTRVRPDFNVRNNQGYSWHIDVPATEYQISISLDDALIYANEYVDYDLPF